MFDTVVSKLVKTIGADVYIPVSSVAAAQDLAPLSLVERKASKWWLGDNTYSITEFVLSDVVDGEDLKIGIKSSKYLAAFNKTSKLKVNGKLSTHFKSTFSAELSNVDTVTVKANLGELHSVEVCQQSMLDTFVERKLNMKHELLKELMTKNRRALCVVVGVVKTTTPTTIESTLDLDLNMDEEACIALPAVDGAGEEIKLDIEKDRTRSISLPAGTVLAYQVMELSISDQGNVRVMVSRSAQGGFHAKIDTVDVVSITPAGSVTVYENDASLRRENSKGYSSLPDETRKQLAAGLLLTSECEENLKELSALLYSPGNSSEQASVQAVLDVISDYRNDSDVTKSVHSVCRILRNLDAESLNLLSAVPASQLPTLYNILKATHTGQHLPLDDKLVKVLLTAAPESLKFLLCGLEYTLDGQALQPHVKKNNVLVSSAHAAVFGLYTCYST